MSRRQTVRPDPSPHVTPEGARALQDELAGLWQRRAGVVAALAAAAAEGDRSENAEYIYRRKELRHLDRRLGYLQRRIPGLQVVRNVAHADRVLFGAWVELEDESGNLERKRIVGSDEIDRHADHVSIDSPLARALLGKRPGAEVTLRLAQGPVTWLLCRVGYASGDGGIDWCDA